MRIGEFIKNICKENEIWEYAKDVPGSIIWLEKGIKIKESFCQLCKKRFIEEGYVQIELPLLIPLEKYKLQHQHYRGLLPYTLKVSHPNIKNYGMYVLKTTSEIPFTDFFKRISESKKLPFKYFQVTTVFRMEKHLLPPIRSLEINPFIESYTAFSSESDANNQIMIEIKIYKEILDNMGLVYTISRRPKYDTFPEAKYTIAFDAILLSGVVTQVATVHNLGSSFSKAFNWKIMDNYPTQTSTGISGRAIAAMLITYYNEKEKAIFLPNNFLTTIKDGLEVDMPYMNNIDTYRKIKSFIVTYNSIEELVKNKDWVVAKLPLIDDENTILKLKNALPTSLKILGIGLNTLSKEESCVITGKPTSKVVNIAREVL